MCFRCSGDNSGVIPRGSGGGSSSRTEQNVSGKGNSWRGNECSPFCNREPTSGIFSRSGSRPIAPRGPLVPPCKSGRLWFPRMRGGCRAQGKGSTVPGAAAGSSGAAGRLPPGRRDPAAASGHPKDGKKSPSRKPVLLMGINRVGQRF